MCVCICVCMGCDRVSSGDDELCTYVCRRVNASISTAVRFASAESVPCRPTSLRTDKPGILLSIDLEIPKYLHGRIVRLSGQVHTRTHSTPNSSDRPS